MAGNGVGFSEGGWQTVNNVDFAKAKKQFNGQLNLAPKQKVVILKSADFHAEAPWEPAESTNPFPKIT